jgi:MYXO-CTERM domain-containing protein
MITLYNIFIGGQPITNLTVYSPNPLGASQEFLTVNTVATPEPSGSVMAALAGLAAFVAARRRRARNN